MTTPAPVPASIPADTDADADAFAAHWFSGQHLYGDDFDAAAVAAWFADEEHGYAELEGSDPARHDYGYHAFNQRHGFAHLPGHSHFDNALGFGSNFGDELLPLLPRIGRVCLMDSSSRFVVTTLANKPVHYVLAQPSGEIALPSNSVQLITAFSVLHHIPNVSFVLRELVRVLAPGGYLLLREPVTTMGDWRAPRVGLTRRERGLPKAWLLAQVQQTALNITRMNDCQFPPWVRLCHRLGANVFGNPLLSAVDAFLSRAFAGNARYHRPGFGAKFAPASVFIVAQKATGESAD